MLILESGARGARGGELENSTVIVQKCAEQRLVWFVYVCVEAVGVGVSLL